MAQELSEDNKTRKIFLKNNKKENKMDINKVTIIGRLTQDPELRQVGTGSSVCSFSIANNRSYTKDGEKKENVSYVNCVAWGKTGEMIAQYCKKGKQVAIDGRLQSDSWEDKETGKKRSALKVIVESFQFLSNAKEHGQSSVADYPDNEIPF